MKKFNILVMSLVAALMLTSAITANAQETFTGNVFKYGSGAYTGMRTANFTLKLTGMTADDQSAQLLNTLQEKGQSGLLDSVRGQDLGSFSLDQGLARTINAVREVNVGGKRKIYAIFERWEQFAEIRGGYRSLDYPFGYIEITIDPRTGKGSGQYFAAAKIRMKKDKKTGGMQVEIEDYATFPAKLVNVESSMKR